MKRSPVTNASRLRVRALAASALLLLCTACGFEHTADDDDDDDSGQTGNIAILAGDATQEGSTNATGAAARFKAPRGITIDASGNLYVADTGNFTIRKITPEGVVTTLAGTAGRGEFAEGSGSRARFLNPVAITINAQGTLFVADNLRIRSVNSSTGLVSTVTEIPVGTNVDARSMNAVLPGAIAVDANGNLYATNGYGTRQITAFGTTMLEGDATQNDLFGTRLFTPRGVAVNGSGTVFVFDLERKISRWTPSGVLGSGNFETLAGAPNTSGSANGTGAAARFSQVVALTLDGQGNLYAADNGNNLVRRITPAGVVTTVAGVSGADALRTGALPGSLAEIRGIVSDGNGNLYATSGNAVVKITLE
ncbi:NHL domain-containing protein [Massilia niastensis]|uniref:NHL domain-containing protein n=1 Tax=Massilia niastensis TaxID=544911 RepID=UPI0003792BAE|nr:hypothetical protein [Massilia niastensis]